MKEKFFALLVLILCISCGGGNNESTDNTEIQPNTSECVEAIYFTNGTDSNNAETYWDCNAAYQNYQAYFFEDGSGYSTVSGWFTWTQNCETFSLVTSFGTQSLTDLSYSNSYNVVSFTLEGNPTTCALYSNVSWIYYGTFNFNYDNSLTGGVCETVMPNLFSIYSDGYNAYAYDINDQLIFSGIWIDESSFNFDYEGVSCYSQISAWDGSMETICENASGDSCETNYEQ